MIWKEVTLENKFPPDNPSTITLKYISGAKEHTLCLFITLNKNKES